MKPLLLLISLVVTVVASAEERFLVPIHLIDPVEGAFGSRWVSELTVVNTGPTGARIDNYGDCQPVPGWCVVPLTTGVAYRDMPIRGLVWGYGIPAAVLVIEDQFAGQFTFSARVRDTSRSAESWGSWIPVVREGAFSREQLPLLDIPITPGFRQMLRVYSLDPFFAGETVRVRAYGIVKPDPADPSTYLQPNPLIADFRVTLRHAPGTDSMPRYAEVADLGGTIGSSYDSIWITLEPEGDFGVWGMVSVTNNVTQEVTTIFPHRN